MYGGASCPGFGSHYMGGLASAELTIGPQRVLHRFFKSVARITYTAEVFEAVTGFMPTLYHAPERGSSLSTLISEPTSAQVAGPVSQPTMTPWSTVDGSPGGLLWVRSRLSLE
jgi:hypothetical protein